MMTPLLFLASLLSLSSTAISPLESSSCDFGVVHPFNHVTCQVTVDNPTDSNWVIEELKAADEGIGVRTALPLRIPAKSSKRLVLTWDSAQAMGQKRLTARFGAKEKGRDESMQFLVRGSAFVYTVLDEPATKLELGTIAVGSGEQREHVFQSSDVTNFRITKVISTPKFVAIKLGGDGKKLTVGLSEEAQWGMQSGFLRLATNVHDEPEIRLLVTANVLGDVRPADNPYSLGVLRTNNDNHVAVQVSSVDGKPFKIGSISLDRISGTVKVSSCTSELPDCKLIDLKISKKQPTGNLGSQMHIHLPDRGKTLTVGLWGILLSPTTEVRDLNKAQEAASEGAKSKAVTGKMDITKVLKSAMRPPARPPANPPGQGPILRWSVANEQPLYGYLIYRADQKDGPWRRVNDEIIPVLGHDDAESSYAWRDTSATAGQTYWYFIKTLANDGTKKRLTEAQKVVAH